MARVFRHSETFECVTRLYNTRFASSDGQPAYPKRVPWHKKQGEWKSKLTVFAPDEGKAIGPDIVNFFRGPLSFKQWFANMKEGHADYLQRFIPERHDILGCDLATAHFLVHRGGSVKFCDHSEWIKKDENEEYDLPSKYVPGMYLEAIDASSTELRYEGLRNFISLRRLKWLNLSNCPHIDDWCLDKISGELRTLEYLDISDCKQVTYRGLSAFYRFESLKHLKVNNIASSREFEFMCLMLEDVFPHLVIEGVKYIDVQPPETSYFVQVGKLWRSRRRRPDLSQELEDSHQQATWVASYRVFSPLSNSESRPSPVLSPSSSFPLHPAPCMGLFLPAGSLPGPGAPAAPAAANAPSPPSYEESLKHKVILSSYPLTVVLPPAGTPGAVVGAALAPIPPVPTPAPSPNTPGD